MIGTARTQPPASTVIQSEAKDPQVPLKLSLSESPDKASRYSLNFSAMVRNALNNVNLANPVSVLQSPLFGKSNALAGGFFSSSASNRSIDLQVNVSL